MNWTALWTDGCFHQPLSDDLSAPYEQRRALFAIGTGHGGAGGGSKGSRRGPRFSAVRMRERQAQYAARDEARRAELKHLATIPVRRRTTAEKQRVARLREIERARRRFEKAQERRAPRLAARLAKAEARLRIRADRNEAKRRARQAQQAKRGDLPIVRPTRGEFARMIAREAELGPAGRWEPGEDVAELFRQLSSEKQEEFIDQYMEDDEAFIDNNGEPLGKKRTFFNPYQSSV
jgi:hypothetical protein